MTEICKKSLIIGLVTTEYVTEDNFDGGLSNYTYRVALSLKQIGHTPIILLVTNTPGQVFIHQGIEVHRIKVRGWKLMRLVNLLTLNKLNSVIFQLCLSLCILFYIKKIHRSACLSILQYPSCAGLGLFRPKNLPCVIRISSYIPLWNKAYEMERTINLRLSEKIEDIAYLKADALFAPSYLNARAVENAIGRPVKVIETPFILETTELDDSIYRKYLENKKYLLFFGTIGLMKGCGLIAEIIYELLDKELDLYFAFVGKDKGYLGYKGESIIDRIRKNAKQHVERVIHLDRLPHKYLYPIISHSYAVILPSRIDNMPNTCLEAMGHRKIVIGTDGASFEQLIVDGISGFLCKIDDKQSLLEKIRKVLSLCPEEKKIIENNASQRIQELHPDKVVNQLVEFYRQVINDFYHKNLNQ